MKRVIILQLNRMGDIITTLPMIMTLKKTFKECHITLVCYREFSRLFTHSPAGNRIDRYVQVETSEAEKLFTFNKIPEPKDSPFPELYEEYDIAVNLVFPEPAAKMFSQIKAKDKYGRLGTRKGEIRFAGDWAKYLFSCIPYRDYNLFNLTDLYTRYCGQSNQEIKDYIPCSPQQMNHAREILKEKGYLGNSIVAFQLGASEAMRRWDLKNFILLGRLLKDYDPKLEILLIGSKDEKNLAEEFITNAPYPVLNLVGETDVLEVPGVIKACRLLVSGDTGPIHIASAVGTPTLGLYFVAAYVAETGPYGVGNMVIQSDLPCQPCVDYYKCSHKNCRRYVIPEAVTFAAKAILSQQFDTTFDFPNLTLYRSRFMENGSLIYLPFMQSPKKPLSEKFQKGLLYRMMWEKEEDLAFYLKLIEDQFPELLHPGVFQNLISIYIKELENLREIFSIGQTSCETLISQFTKPGGPDTNAIAKPVKNLNIIESFIEKREEPLSPLKYYFSFEMMDMEYLQFPALAKELREKYVKLGNKTIAFIKNLQKIHKSKD